VVLARQNFADPLVAIPCAISSLTHSLLASVLAGFWRRTASAPKVSEARTMDENTETVDRAGIR
jgi:bile acid:Na+ symporter, BASS family